MSYDLWIEDKNGNLMGSPLKIHPKGAIFPIDGTKKLETSVTFNYYDSFRKAFHDAKGLKILNNMPCLESIPKIRNAMDELDNDISDNYWEPTEGNAKVALQELLHLAALGCNGIWRMSW